MAAGFLAFLAAVAKAILAMIGFGRDKILVDAGKALARDEGRREAERQEAKGKAAAREVAKKPVEEDDGFRRD